MEGAQADRFPLVVGNERMIPGFEANLVGMKEDEEKTFTVTFPDDYGEDELAGQEVVFTAKLLELRERRLPETNDEFAGVVGPYDDIAGLRADLRQRMIGNSFDRARHTFSDRIIEYATSNATVEVPDVLVDREVEVMLDELKVRVSEQGIGYEDYLRVTEKDEATMKAEYRDGAEHRVKVLLVLGAIADAENVTVADADVEAEVARVREDESSGDSITDYLDSERGRAYIRMQLRRSQTVEMLVDRWIDAHPEFSEVQHTHQPAPADGTAAIEEAAIEAAAAIVDSATATEPEPEPEREPEVAEAKGAAS